MIGSRFAIVVGGLLGAYFLQPNIGEANHERRLNDFRYTPDVDVSRLIACGHRSTFADAVWLGSLPDLAREFHDKKLKERWLSGVFEVVTDLEPTFYTAYDFGSTYLALINKQADSAIALLERGVDRFGELEEEDGRAYPVRGLLYRELAMAWFTYKKDKEQAFEILDIAVQRPDCDLLTRAMWANWKVQAGGELMALTMWAELKEHQNANVRFQADRGFERTKRDIVLRAWREFEERTGSAPQELDELRTSGILLDGVAEVVTQDVEIGDDGRPDFPRVADLDREHWRRAAENAAWVYRNDEHAGNGSWPPLEYVLSNNLSGPAEAPPPGCCWHFEDGKLTAVPLDE